jgi:hypothetical protein
MRTTVTIDPDVEALLRQAMRERGEPFKQVLNNAVREGLLRMAREKAKPEKLFKQPVAHMGAELVDLTKALALAAELEDLEIIAKMRQGR